jgi:hypothetical protein
MMIRRFIAGGLAAALVTPVIAVPPASAIVLFTCTSDPGEAYGGPAHFSYARVHPGLQHTPSSQDVVGQIPLSATACSNGEQTNGLLFGQPFTDEAVTTFPPRPLGCPAAWGGAGPDYPDQTPILIGAEGSFETYWTKEPSGPSAGIAKVKQGPAGDQWRFVFVITSGKYAPPLGQKTKIKGTLNFAPHPGVSYSCVSGSDPLDFLDFSSGTLIAQQK